MILNPYVYGSSAGGSYLDGLATPPRALYSFRKMYSTATSSMRVRRSSDNAEQDIGFSGNSLDTAALAAFVGAGSGFVVTWYDQTGNGEHANQTTAASQPRIVNAGSVQSRISFDNSNDHLIVTSLTMGAAYCGVYFKGTIPVASAAVDIYMEMSANYNSNAQSWVFYGDTSIGSGHKVNSRNSTSANDYKMHTYNTAGTGQFTFLLDRSTTGTDEIKFYSGGTLLTPTLPSFNVEQTGVYNSYDLYIGGRVAGSFYSALELETLVVYNADSSAIRTSVEAIVA